MNENSLPSTQTQCNKYHFYPQLKIITLKIPGSVRFASSGDSDGRFLIPAHFIISLHTNSACFECPKLMFFNNLLWENICVYSITLCREVQVSLLWELLYLLAKQRYCLSFTQYQDLYNRARLSPEMFFNKSISAHPPTD